MHDLRFFGGNGEGGWDSLSRDTVIERDGRTGAGRRERGRTSTEWEAPLPRQTGTGEAARVA